MSKVNARTLGRNSAYAGLSEVWRIGSRIVLTPIIITRIGLDGYGVWTLLFSVCAYVQVVHSSFGLAYTKFAAECDASEDYDTLSEIVAAGMMLVGAFGLAALALLWAVGKPLLGVLGVPPEMLTSAIAALMIVAVCVVLRMSLGCVLEVLPGFQRLDLRHKIGIATSAIEFVVALWLLHRGWGLVGLAGAHMAGLWFSIITAWVACRRICPGFRLNPGRVTRTAIRRVLSLGGRFQLLYVITLLNTQGFKLMVSAVLGPAALAIYEIARKILVLGDAAGGAVVAPLMPAFANVHAGDQAAKRQAIFDHGSRVLSVISLVSFGFLAVFADRLILLWTAQEYPLAAWTVRAFAAAYVLKHLTGVATAALRGQGTVRLEIGFALLAGAIWLLGIVPAYWLWGYHGMVVTAATSLLGGSLWFLHRFCREQCISLGAYLRRSLAQPALILAPVIAAAAIAGRFVTFDPAALEGRFGVLFGLLVWGTIFAAASFIAAWFGVLSKLERETIRSRLLRKKPDLTPKQAPTP